MPIITDELRIEANMLDPEQTAPRSSLIWVDAVCHRGFLNVSADEKNRRLLLQLAHYGLKLGSRNYYHTISESIFSTTRPITITYQELNYK